MKFEKVSKVIYYKFEVHNRTTNEYRMFQNYKKLQEYINIPRSSLYQNMGGKEIQKWNCYGFKQIRIPIRNLSN
tara:strand:- start:212 stop:433 length:222 start_codon:yes stop_codon:yes gene_type:complete